MFNRFYSYLFNFFVCRVCFYMILNHLCPFFSASALHTSLIAKLNRISSGAQTRTEPLRSVICIWTFRSVFFGRHLGQSAASSPWRKCSTIVAGWEDSFRYSRSPIYPPPIQAMI